MAYSSWIVCPSIRWSVQHSVFVFPLQAMDIFDIAEGYNSLEEALERVVCPSMVIGVKTDILFPIIQQRELATSLTKSGW